MFSLALSKHEFVVNYESKSRIMENEQGSTV